MSVAPEHGVKCKTCRGVGALEEGPCFACKGRGYFEAEEDDDGLDLELDFDELVCADDTSVPSKTVSSSVFDGDQDMFGVNSDDPPSAAGDSDEAPSAADGSDIVFDLGPTESQGQSPKPSKPSSDIAQADPKRELEELLKQQKQNAERIRVLESLIAGLGDQSGAEHRSDAKSGPPKTVNEILSFLGECQLLNPSQIRDAEALRDDAKLFAQGLVNANFLTQWQMEQVLGGRTSFLLDKHRLLDVLGPTPTGVVLLGEHISMNRKCAIKILSRKLSQKQDVVQRFLNQARTLATIDHPNIIHVYNAGQASGRYHVVVEYVEGRDLEHIAAEKGPFPFGLVSDFICQAAKGLHHGHINKIIHGDVRPSNLMVNRDRKIQIDYLGLSRFHEKGYSGQLGTTLPNRKFQTVDSFAPECKGIRSMQPSCDIYGLGCTMYFLLTGQVPFPKGSPSDKLEQQQFADPERIRTLRFDTPQELVQVCERMMAKKPEDRYATCEEVATDLEPMLRK
jgi:hypothetical protein